MLDAKARPRAHTAIEPRPARTRGHGRPSVSVVCVASSDATTVFRDLAECSARWQRMGVELLIVCTTRPSAAALALMTAPGARIIYAPASATDQQLRAMGLAAAAGDVVMLVDEAAEADEGWMERLCAGRGSGVDSARTEEDAHLQP